MQYLNRLALVTALISANVQAQTPQVEMPASGATCVACHGPGGNSTNPLYPVLAGQNARYIYLQLKDYKQDRRSHPLMSPVAKALATEEMLALATYFAAQPRRNEVEQGNPALVARGKQVADDALCAMCHLGGFSGQNEVPRVNGQHYSYILAQLLAFKTGTRTNDAGNMAAVVKTLPDEDLKALAAYIANTP